MSGRDLRLVVLVLAVTACGGPPSPLAVRIDQTSRALFPELASASVRLHNSEADCSSILLSGEDKMAVYAVTVAVLEGAVVGSGRIDDIKAGTYSLAIWGYDGAQLPIAFGCKQGITIEDGKETIETITLAAP